MFSENLLGFALMAHLAGEFIFQTDAVAANKSNLKTKAGRQALFKHTAIIFVANIISMYMLLSGLLPLAGAAAVTLSHLAIDFLKTRFFAKRCTARFLTDQLLHFAVILAAVYFMSASPYLRSSPFAKLIQDSGADIKTIVWTIDIFIGFVWGAAYLIRCILKDSRLYCETPPEGDAPSKSVSTAQAGKWIGMLERINHADTHRHRPVGGVRAAANGQGFGAPHAIER